LLEIALLLVAALELDFAELLRCFLQLAGETLAVQAKRGEGAVGVDDEREAILRAGWWMLLSRRVRLMGEWGERWLVTGDQGITSH